MKKPGLWIALAVALAFFAMMYSSFQGVTQYRVEVCMEYQGRNACRVAAASTAEQAQRTATENACALIASGMTDSMACSSTPPVKVTWVEGKK
jgi:hypothetical protein